MPPDRRNVCWAHPGRTHPCDLCSADQFVGAGGTFIPSSNQPSYPSPQVYYPPTPPSGGIYPSRPGARQSVGSAAQGNGLTRRDLDALTRVSGFQSPAQNALYYPPSLDINTMLSDPPANPSSTPSRPPTQPRCPPSTNETPQGPGSRERRMTQENPGQGNIAMAQPPNSFVQPGANGSTRDQYNTICRVPAYTDEVNRGSNRPRVQRRTRRASDSQEDSDDDASRRARAPRR